MRPMLDLSGFEADPMRPSLLEDVPTEQEARYLRAARVIAIGTILCPILTAALVWLAFKAVH